MSRVQLALNVDDLDESIAFYSTLFGTEPAKTRPGYANFAVAEPPLKLVLIENPGQGGIAQPPRRRGRRRRHRRRRADPARRRPGSPRSTSAAPPAATPSRTSSGSRARPNGERWEVYTVLADSQTFGAADRAEAGTCCGGEAGLTLEPTATACC